MRSLEEIFYQIDRMYYYGFSFKLMKVVSDRMGIFKVNRPEEMDQNSQEEFMESYETGDMERARREKLRLKEKLPEMDDEKAEMMARLEMELKREERKYFRNISGYQRQVRKPLISPLTNFFNREIKFPVQCHSQCS
jgi:hypothetical protein